MTMTTLRSSSRSSKVNTANEDPPVPAEPSPSSDGFSHVGPDPDTPPEGGQPGTTSSPNAAYLKEIVDGLGTPPDSTDNRKRPAKEEKKQQTQQQVA